MICKFFPSECGSTILVDDVHDLWLTTTSEIPFKCWLTRGKLMIRKVLQSCGTKCDKPHESLSANSRPTSHRVFRAREAAAYHGAAFRIWQIPSRRSLARLALALMGTADGRAELGVGWMLVLLGVLAIDSWQGRAGMTAAVSYARGSLLARAWQAWLLRLCAVTTKARQGEQGSDDKHKAIVKASHLVREWIAREGLMVCSRVEWLLHA